MRLLMLTAGTGSGHASVSDGLTDALGAYVSAGLEVITAAPLGNAVNRCYGWMLTRAPRLWGACYAASNQAALGRATTRLLHLRQGRNMRDLVNEVQPDAIVSVHALCTQLALRCLREIRKDIAVFNVVTDLMDIHRSWVAAGVDLYFAGTEDAARAIEALGVPSHCIVVSGIPLRRQFWPGNGAAPHRMAGLASTLEDVFPRSSHRLRVLALDGGVPGPQLPQVVDTLSGAGISMDIVVGWGGAEPPRPAHKLLGANRASVRHLALGEPISPHMRKVDLVITKAGSVTIAESLALARPLLLHRVAPGQESSNPSLVERFGAGLHVPTLRHVVDTLRRLDACPEEIARMRANARLHGRPDAANDVAAHIMRSLNVAEQVCDGAAG